jgi:hypothetical protein
MLYQNPAIQSRVEVHLVEEAKGGPSKLLLSFLFYLLTGTVLLPFSPIPVESFRFPFPSYSDSLPFPMGIPVFRSSLS